MAIGEKGIVVDANILIRAVLGIRQREILTRYKDSIRFYAADVCFHDARKYVPAIHRRRSFDVVKALEALDVLEEKSVLTVNPEVYVAYEKEARERIQSRDPDDWPILATALALDLPIWTEDRDFFGCGIATWITRTVEIYLRQGESA
jgi:predicted nucleic acid-binding protein